MDIAGIAAVGSSRLWAAANEWTTPLGPANLAGGQRGVILHSRNGGKTWEERFVAFGRDLSRVYFFNEQTGWVSGDAGLILHTTDGGSSWQAQSTRTNRSLLEVTFLSPLVGWVLASEGRLLRTLDGGLNWSEQEVAIDDHLYSLSFTDAYRGWVVGENGAYETADGGVTWKERRRDLLRNLLDWNTQLIEFKDVRFFDEQTGFVSASVSVKNAGAHAVIFRTDDGGRKWRIVQVPGAHGLWSVQFVTRKEMWVVTSGPDPLVHTLDGGKSWRWFDCPGTVRRVHFVDSKSGWFIGHTDDFSSRGIFHTTDAGETWRNLVVGIEPNLRQQSR
ncbi:MAG: YCF48-related protein [Acidobacteriota bacterium]